MKNTNRTVILMTMMILLSSAVFAQVDSTSTAKADQQIEQTVQQLEITQAQLKLERVDLEKRLKEIDELLPRIAGRIEGVRAAQSVYKKAKEE